MNAELGDKSKLLRTLRKDEKRLKSELRKKRTDHEGLNKAIEKAIRKDMAARRKNERDKKPNKKDVNKKVILNNLFKKTPLQISFGGLILALVGRQPVVLSLRELILLFIHFRKQTLRRKLQYYLKLQAAQW